MAAAAILNLLLLSILVTQSTSGSSWLHYSKILLVYVSRQLSHCYCAKITTSILNFIFVQYFGMLVCTTSKVIHMPNFVQLFAIINELWAINKIQNGGRRHLKFIILSILVKWYFNWQPSTFLQNFIRLRQSAAELLLFVQKSKMAAAAILDFIFV